MTAVKTGAIRPVDDIDHHATRAAPRRGPAIAGHGHPPGPRAAVGGPDPSGAAEPGDGDPRRAAVDRPTTSRAVRARPRSADPAGRPRLVALRRRAHPRGRRRDGRRSTPADTHRDPRPPLPRPRHRRRPGPTRPRRSSWTCACRGSSRRCSSGCGAGGRRRDVPGPAAQPAGRPVRARDGVGRGARGGDRRPHPGPLRRPRVRAGPRPRVRRGARRRSRSSTGSRGTAGWRR